MKVLKAIRFAIAKPLETVTDFINKNGIKKEDILMITQNDVSYTVFYYTEQ